MNEKLISKITNKNVSIGIIGLGYVGLPLALRFSKEEYNVIGFDVDIGKVNMLNSGKSYIKHIKSTEIATANQNDFIASNDFSLIKGIDVIIICVPTPLGIHNEPDLKYIKGTLKSISKYLQKGGLLILESTTYPGTTDEEIIPFLKKLNFTCGEDFFVGYSPEREDPGNKNFTTKTIPKIVSGYSAACLEATEKLYSEIIDKTVPVSSLKVAEMTKIVENIHRAVNIGLVNELKIVADKMNIDIYEVIDAAKTKPFGFTPYYPGPGLGGHCIPIDPFYLTWKAKEYGMNTRFIELAGEINTSMPEFVVLKIIDALNSHGKSIKNSNVLILGLSYKKNVDDLRESPSFEIIEKCTLMGANIKFSDPYFIKIPRTRKHNFDLESIELNKKTLNKMDLVVLCTDHDDFDYDLILKYSKIVVDTRGRYSRESPNVVKA